MSQHQQRPARPGRPDPARGVYGISVAAELAGLHPQTLRGYDASGLLDPHRTPGGTRRYSDHDLDRIRRIAQLAALGLNTAGIRLVLQLEEENHQLRGELRNLRNDGPRPT